MRLKIFQKRVMSFYGNIPIKNITPSKHQEFINDLIKKGYSKSTIKKSHAFLKRALQRAMYDRLIHSNPCDGIELKHRI